MSNHFYISLQRHMVTRDKRSRSRGVLCSRPPPRGGGFEAHFFGPRGGVEAPFFGREAPEKRFRGAEGAALEKFSEILKKL